MLPTRPRFALIAGLIGIGTLTLLHPQRVHATEATITTNESANSLVNISVNSYIEAVTKASKGKLKLNINVPGQGHAPAVLL